MAKDRKKLQHIHSSIADKQPTPQTLEVGEIAVNNAANQEFLSLKNSDNKVVRFSSDEQMITWMEKKEVMPYSGTVDNVHLDTNRSNIEIKLNQVVAKNTAKYNVVNGAKDIDGQEVNPSSDGGLTNGAGFAIDMSRYAMIGANPSFSSITVTHRSNLSGSTNISNGAGGTALNITTTDVTANDTNWTETITNKKSTVTTEEDKITTLKESATTRTTVVGTENLTVSGATTEVHTGNVTINNSSAKTENTTGVLTENNSSNHIVNTTGTTTIKSTGSTNIETNGANNKVTIQASGTGGDIEVFAKDTLCESGVTAAFNGTTKTNIGLNCNDTTSAATTNIYGTTINEKANTANTNVTSAYTSATTATTVIGTANTSATTATLSGTNLTINESNTVISSCTKVDIVTNDLNIKQCTTGTVDFDFCNGFTVNSNNIKLHQCASAGTISISAQTQNINGGNLTINESGNTAINTTGTTNIKSTGNTNVETNGANNKVTIQASGTGGDVEVFAKDTLNETGATVNISGSSSANVSGATVNVSGGSICETASGTAAFVGAIKTNIGTNCSDGGNTATLNVRGVTTNISAGTITQTTSGNTTVNVGGNLTESVVGTTTENHGGAVTINNASGYTVYTTGNTCITSSGNLTMGGDGNTNIGYNCAGTGIANNVNIYASTGVTVNAPTTNITGNTNISGNTVVKGTTNISGATTIGGATTINNNLTVTGNTNISGNTAVKGTLDVIGGLTKSVTWALGTPSADTIGYNGSANKTITIPSSTSHLTKSTLTIDYNTDVRSKADTSYNTEAAATVSIPGSIDHLSNYDGTNITLPHPVLVSGTVTASGAIYSSDRNLKENIDFVKREEFNKAKNIFAKSYNLKSDESKAKTYGVIAQEVQEAGLPELVKITDDKGTLGVDYTSLFVLKIAYLEDFCAMLNGRIVELENRIKELENKD